MDSAFYGRNPVHAALAGGAQVSVTTRMDNRVKAAIAAIPDDAWTMIEYTDAVFDETSGQWISRAEVAEIAFTAFAAQPKRDQVPGRLIVRRIPDFHAEKHRAAGQDGLFDVWRFHAFFTTTDPPAARHRDRGQGPPSSRDHRTGPRRPEELRSRAPAVRGVHRERRLARARRDRVQPDPRRRHPRRTPDLARATTATVRRTLIQIPCRVATSARRLIMHLPQDWPWQTAWTQLNDRVADPPTTVTS